MPQNLTPDQTQRLNALAEDADFQALSEAEQKSVVDALMKSTAEATAAADSVIPARKGTIAPPPTAAEKIRLGMIQAPQYVAETILPEVAQAGAAAVTKSPWLASAARYGTAALTGGLGRELTQQLSEIEDPTARGAIAGSLAIPIPGLGALLGMATERWAESEEKARGDQGAGLYNPRRTESTGDAITTGAAGAFFGEALGSGATKAAKVFKPRASALYRAAQEAGVDPRNLPLAHQSKVWWPSWLNRASENSAISRNMMANHADELVTDLDRALNESLEDIFRVGSTPESMVNPLPGSNTAIGKAVQDQLKQVRQTWQNAMDRNYDLVAMGVRAVDPTVDMRPLKAQIRDSFGDLLSIEGSAQDTGAIQAIQALKTYLDLPDTLPYAQAHILVKDLGNATRAMTNYTLETAVDRDLRQTLSGEMEKSLRKSGMPEMADIIATVRQQYADGIAKFEKSVIEQAIQTEYPSQVARMIFNQGARPENAEYAYELLKGTPAWNSVRREGFQTMIQDSMRSAAPDASLARKWAKLDPRQKELITSGPEHLQRINTIMEIMGKAQPRAWGESLRGTGRRLTDLDRNGISMMMARTLVGGAAFTTSSEFGGDPATSTGLAAGAVMMTIVAPAVMAKILASGPGSKAFIKGFEQVVDPTNQMAARTLLRVGNNLTNWAGTVTDNLEVMADVGEGPIPGLEPEPSEELVP